jgi:hypothetical protein
MVRCGGRGKHSLVAILELLCGATTEKFCSCAEAAPSATASAAAAARMAQQRGASQTVQRGRAGGPKRHHFACWALRHSADGRCGSVVLARVL